MPPDPTTLCVRLTESRDRIPLNRERWNALAGRNATSTVFQTWEWFDAWWSAFGDDNRLYFLSVHDSDETIGFAPLMMIRGRLGLRQLEFISSPNADYQDLVIPERRAEVVPLICRFLHERRRHWDMLVFRNVPTESPSRSELGAAFSQLGLGSMDRERVGCPALRIAGHDDEVRDLLQRYSIMRKVRGLEHRGPVAYRVLGSQPQIEAHLPVFFSQHLQRREAAGTPSQFLDPRHRAWFGHMARTMREAGWLHFSAIECAGNPAAYHFGFQFNNTLNWYKPSFERRYASQSPGIVLIRSLIEDARTRGLGELDFSGGEEPFKKRFSNTQRTTLNLRFFSRRSLHLAFTAAGRLRRTAGDLWRAVR